MSVSSGKTLLTLASVFLFALSVSTNQAPRAFAEATAGPVITKPGKPSMIQTSEAAKPSSYNAKTLHRLDFRVVGKSCAKCLMDIQKVFKSMPGVVKAAVMLKKPYGAVVIYDSSKVSKEELLKKARDQDKDVRIEEAIDRAIPKLPIILIPIYALPRSPVTSPSADANK